MGFKKRKTPGNVKYAVVLSPSKRTPEGLRALGKVYAKPDPQSKEYMGWTTQPIDDCYMSLEEAKVLADEVYQEEGDLWKVKTLRINRP